MSKIDTTFDMSADFTNPERVVNISDEIVASITWHLLLVAPNHAAQHRIAGTTLYFALSLVKSPAKQGRISLCLVGGFT